MAKASVIAARQAQALETTAALLADILARLERIEAKLDQLAKEQAGLAEKKVAK